MKKFISLIIALITLFCLSSLFTGCEPSIARDDTGILANETTTTTINPLSILYVSNNGLDSNSGEKDSPLKTIQKAIDIVTASKNAIFIEAGTYEESISITTTTPIVIKGSYNTAFDTQDLTNITTIIKGADNEVASTTKKGRLTIGTGTTVTLNGLSIYDAAYKDTVNTINHVYCLSNSGKLTIDNCILKGSTIMDDYYSSGSTVGIENKAGGELNILNSSVYGLEDVSNDYPISMIGDGLYGVYNDGILDISNSNVYGAYTVGAYCTVSAVYNNLGTATITDSTIYGADTTSGSGVAILGNVYGVYNNIDGTTNITNSILYGTAGGVYVRGFCAFGIRNDGKIDVSDSTMYGMVEEAYGDASCGISNSGEATVSNCNIYGATDNTSGWNGSIFGVENTYGGSMGKIDISDSNIYGATDNVHEGYGSIYGFSFYDGLEATITNCTIYGAKDNVSASKNIYGISASGYYTDVNGYNQTIKINNSIIYGCNSNMIAGSYYEGTSSHVYGIYTKNAITINIDNTKIYGASGNAKIASGSYGFAIKGAITKITLKATEIYGEKELTGAASIIKALGFFDSKTSQVTFQNPAGVIKHKYTGTINLWNNLNEYDGDAEIYVSSNSGSDNNDGAKTSPVKTIQKALSLSMTPQKTTIYVESGIYEELLNISFLTLINNNMTPFPLTIKGGYNSSFTTQDFNNKSILRGPVGEDAPYDAGRINLNWASATISGFEIYGAVSSEAIGITKNYGDLTVDNCKIVAIENGSISAAYGIRAYSGNNLISNSTIYSAAGVANVGTAYGIYNSHISTEATISGNSAIYGATENATVNTVYAIYSKSGLYIESGVQIYGAAKTGAGSPTVENCYGLALGSSSYLTSCSIYGEKDLTTTLPQADKLKAIAFHSGITKSSITWNTPAGVVKDRFTDAENLWNNLP